MSLIDVEGAPFHDPAAREALVGALREHVDRDRVEVVERPEAINDPAFARAAADRLHALVGERADRAGAAG